MPAYMTNIIQKCKCGGVAFWQVFNKHNANMGYFCGRCGEEEVERLNKDIRDAKQKTQRQI